MSTAASTNEKTYRGGCHCGFLRYTVDLDLTGREASKCNCSICHKANRLSLRTRPDKLELVSPASLESVPDYRFGSRAQHHYFCSTCGIHCFGKGSYLLQGQEVHYLSINAVTLDQDQGVDLRGFKVQYWDGKGENWLAGAKEEPFPGGCR